jgi:hypothetical protein
MQATMNRDVWQADCGDDAGWIGFLGAIVL